ncbi:unnamed protein product, partial [marine sediment metagenome]
MGKQIRHLFLKEAPAVDPALCPTWQENLRDGSYLMAMNEQINGFLCRYLVLEDTSSVSINQLIHKHCKLGLALL